MDPNESRRFMEERRDRPQILELSSGERLVTIVDPDTLEKKGRIFYIEWLDAKGHSKLFGFPEDEFKKPGTRLIGFSGDEAKTLVSLIVGGLSATSDDLPITGALRKLLHKISSEDAAAIIREKEFEAEEDLTVALQEA